METIAQTTIARPGILFTLELYRHVNGQPFLAIYEKPEGFIRPPERIENINLDQNPELHTIYDWKKQLWNRIIVNELIRAVEESAGV